MGIPLTGLLAAILLLKENPTTELYFGGLIILFGVILIIYTKKENEYEILIGSSSENIHLRKYLILTIIISTGINQFFEIFNKSHEKPDYVKIIDEENKRLGHQVERVLNIARTEKQSYKIDKS